MDEKILALYCLGADFLQALGHMESYAAVKLSETTRVIIFVTYLAR
jgi:hypothetical protein